MSGSHASLYRRTFLIQQFAIYNVLYRKNIRSVSFLDEVVVKGMVNKWNSFRCYKTSVYGFCCLPPV